MRPLPDRYVTRSVAWVSTADRDRQTAPATFAVNASQVTVTVEPTAAEKQLLAAYADAPAELHIPLLNVGDVATLTPDTRVAISTALATIADTTPPLTGTVSGIGWLETHGVTVGIVDCPGLGALRDALADALYDIAPEPGEFLPAVVLSAGSIDGSGIAGIPVHFNELRVRAGTETLVFDLLGPIPAGPEQAPPPEPEAPPTNPIEEPPVAEFPAESAPPAPEAPFMASNTPSTYRTVTTSSTGGLGTLATLDSNYTQVNVRFAEGDPEETLPVDDETTVPAAPLEDVADADLEAELARRAAMIAAEATGEDPAVLLDAATEECAGVIAEIAAELEADDDTDDGTGEEMPPAAGEVPVEPVMYRTRHKFADLAPDVDGDGVGEDPTPELFDWEGILALEGVPTSDGRMFAEGAMTWRELPLTLALQTVTAQGHDGAVVCGSIVEIERVGKSIVGRGRFSSTEAGQLARTLLAEGSLKGVSVDVAAAVVVYTDQDGNEIDDMNEVMFGGASLAVFTEAEMMGATLTPWQAFSGATVTPIDPNVTEPTSLVADAARPGHWTLTGPALFSANVDTAALVASAAPEVPHPPAHLFSLQPDTRQPFTVGAPLPDGTVPCYGLIASWATAHIGVAGRKVYAPRDDDFAWFHTGSKVLTAEGSLIPTGPIFMDTVHPNLRAVASDAQAHYADTGCAVADVRLFAGEHGIVAAGVVRPDVDDLTVRRFRASKVSGDWRPINGKLRMVAVLAVNAGGFPVPFIEGIAASAGRMRPWAAFDGEGEPLAMVAVGAVHRQPTGRERITDLEDRLAALEAQVAAFTASPKRRVVKTRAKVAALPGDVDGPVELSADERAERARAALSSIGVRSRDERAQAALAALGLR